jgi:hypothetical protein
MPLNIIFKGIFLLVSEGDTSMTKKTAASKGIAESFMKVCRLAYIPVGVKIVEKLGEDEELAFHIMHKKFMSESVGHVRDALADSYPFVKLNDRWYVSVPKLYIYLMKARRVIAKSEHPAMVTVYNSIQAASRYYDDWKMLDKQLTPTGHIDYEDYTKRQAELYQNYLMEQLTIFGDLE